MFRRLDKTDQNGMHEIVEESGTGFRIALKCAGMQADR